MVIDSSAICAIFLQEPDSSVYASAILSSPVRLMSAASYVEVSSVAIRRRAPNGLSVVDGLIQRMQIKIVPLDYEQALLGREAYRRYGMGQHKAGLNLGDCFSYALAKQTGEPLLFKGNDFVWTDLVLA